MYSTPLRLSSGEAGFGADSALWEPGRGAWTPLGNQLGGGLEVVLFGEASGG